jgi:hypothetical protein
MERLAVPWLFVGPSGSGKLTEARSTIERALSTPIALPLETKILPIGDGYEARIFTSPHHFEIDIPTLSMQDKQIIAELLATFFASTDVFHALKSSSRKLVILRRAHSLSLPAAIRVRAILHQYVFPPDAVGMIWMTAREITGPLTLLLDGFCVKRVPRLPFASWAPSVPAPYKTLEAYDATEGRVDRVTALAALFPTGCSSYPRRIQDYYDEVLASFLRNASKPPTIAVFSWIRACVYQMLSFCQTGPEIIDSCAAAVERAFAKDPHPLAWRLMAALSHAEPHTSYRTPLALEMMLIGLYEEIRRATPPVREKSKAESVPVSKKRGTKASPKNEVVTTNVVTVSNFEWASPDC